jgi:hypothetical protein
MVLVTWKVCLLSCRLTIWKLTRVLFRHRFTAGYVSELIRNGFKRPHGLLNAYIQHFTDFNITDALIFVKAPTFPLQACFFKTEEKSAMRPLFFCPATNSINVDTDMSKGGEWLRWTAPTSDAAHRGESRSYSFVGSGS